MKIKRDSWHYRFVTNETTGYSRVRFYDAQYKLGDNICSYAVSIAKVLVLTVLYVVGVVSLMLPLPLFLLELSVTPFYEILKTPASGGVIYIVLGSLIQVIVLLAVTAGWILHRLDNGLSIFPGQKKIGYYWHKMVNRVCIPVDYEL